MRIDTRNKKSQGCFVAHRHLQQLNGSFSLSKNRDKNFRHRAFCEVIPPPARGGECFFLRRPMPALINALNAHAGGFDFFIPPPSRNQTATSNSPALIAAVTAGRAGGVDAAAVQVAAVALPTTERKKDQQHRGELDVSCKYFLL